MAEGAAMGMLFCAVAAVLATSMLTVMMVHTVASSVVSIVLAIYSVSEGDYLNALVYGAVAVAGIIGVCRWYKVTYQIDYVGDKGIARFAGWSGNDTKELYRAVGEGEYQDIMSTGKFRGIEGKTLQAKEFGNDFSETLEFANKAINKDKVAIIKVTIPQNVYDKLNHMYLDVSIFKSGTPVVEPDMLNFFNDNIISIDHFF